MSHANWIKRRIERFVNARKPNAIRLLAEGDSWFTFGGWMWGGMSLIEQLNRYRTLNIVSIANLGAELKSMTEDNNRRQWVLACNPDWLNGETYDAVMLSAGGNDVIGAELGGLLHRKTAARSGSQLVKKTVLKSRFQSMDASLSSIRQTIDRLVSPQAPLFMHGYDYAFPSGRPFELLGGLISLGPWIKLEMLDKGIVDDDEQLVVANYLIDQFNEFLIARQSSGFTHLELRGVLSAADWADEIHPTAGGRKKLAKVIRAKIANHFQGGAG